MLGPITDDRQTAEKEPGNDKKTAGGKAVPRKGLKEVSLKACTLFQELHIVQQTEDCWPADVCNSMIANVAGAVGRSITMCMSPSVGSNLRTV